MMINTPEMLSHILKQQRLKQQKSQMQIAERINARQATISHLENQPKSVDLAILLKLLNQLDLEMHLLPKAHQDENKQDKLLW